MANDYITHTNMGSRIQFLIKKSGCTVSEIAGRLDMTSQNLFKIFHKESVGSLYIEEIAYFLRLQISEFFNDGKPMEYESRISEIERLTIENQEQKKRLAELEQIIQDKQEIINLIRESKGVTEKLEKIYIEQNAEVLKQMMITFRNENPDLTIDDIQAVLNETIHVLLHKKLHKD
ncbi:MAG: hypothetical protein HXX13_18485 [Bacteroidetes bacterium]|nr:hypothetical protein [Bacteroidota bacterium]